MMATFVEQSHDKKGGQKKANHTLEDVAEEVLNGMFCHYEPPDPRRAKSKKRRGILRASSRLFPRKKGKTSKKSVRWSDESVVTTDNITETKSSDSKTKHPVEVYCNIHTCCIDAGVEAGCLSPNQKEGAEYDDHDLELNESMSSEAAMRKNAQKKKKKKDEVLLFDDEGMPINAQPGKANPPPPPPPPPPSKKEKFIPSLCGVELNCCDDEEDYMEELAMSPSEGPAKKYHRPSQPYDYEDEENSLLNSEDEEIPTTKAKKPTKRRSIMKEKKIGDSQDDGEPDWETSSANSNTSSTFLRRVWPKRRGRSNKDMEVVPEVDDGPSRGRQMSRSRSHSPRNRKPQPKEELDPVELNRSDNGVSESKPSRSFLRGRSPRKKKMDTSSDDWDDTIPIVPKQSPRDSDDSAPSVPAQSPRRWSLTGRGGRKEPDPRDPSPPKQSPRDSDDSAPNVPAQSPRRWSLTGRGGRKEPDPRDPSPGPIRRMRSSSADAKEGRGRASRKDLDSRDPSPGPFRRTRSRSADVKEDRRRSFDSSSLRKRRPKSPGSLLFRGRSTDGAYDSLQSRSHSFDAAEDLRGADDRMGQQQGYGMEGQGYGMTSRQGFDPQHATYPQMHPAHPLSRREKQDDTMERQSYITAHREGFDTAPSKARKDVGSDTMDRQSYIMAHREGFDAPSEVAQNRMDRNDDLMERQSFITANRQGMDVAALQPIQYPHQRPSLAGRDDRMERQSFITDHRRGFDEAPREQPTPRGRSRSPSTPRGRSRSPFSRRRSFGRKSGNDNRQIHRQSSMEERQLERADTVQMANHHRRRSDPMPPLSRDEMNVQSQRYPVYQDPRAQRQVGIPPMHQQMPGFPMQQQQQPGLPMPQLQQGLQTLQQQQRGPPMPQQQPSVAMPQQRSAVFMPQQQQFGVSMPQQQLNVPVPQQRSSIPIPQQQPGAAMPPQQVAGIPIPTPQQQPSLPTSQQQPSRVPMSQQQYRIPTPQQAPVVPTQYQSAPLNGQPSVESQASASEEENKDESEETWEERTRKAWEQLRGGLAATLPSFEPSKEPEPETQLELEPPVVVQSQSVQSPSHPQEQVYAPQNFVQSPSLPRDQPVGILRNGQERRVKFGPPTEQIFHDDQDENRSMMTIDTGVRKKKKVFRGSKLIKGVFGKAKNTLGSISLSRSRSMELSSSRSSDMLSSSRSSDMLPYDSIYEQYEDSGHRYSTPQQAQAYYPDPRVQQAYHPDPPDSTYGAIPQRAFHLDPPDSVNSPNRQEGDMTLRERKGAGNLMSC